MYFHVVAETCTVTVVVVVVGGGGRCLPVDSGFDLC